MVEKFEFISSERSEWWIRCMLGVTVSQRIRRSIFSGRRRLLCWNWLENRSAVSNAATPTTLAPSRRTAAARMPADSKTSSVWKRIPVVTSKSRSLW